MSTEELSSKSRTVTSAGAKKVVADSSRILAAYSYKKIQQYPARELKFSNEYPPSVPLPRRCYMIFGMNVEYYSAIGLKATDPRDPEKSLHCLSYECKEDMNYFKTMTMGHICIMGYNTWMTLPGKRVLPGRFLFVISDRENVEGLSLNSEKPLSADTMTEGCAQVRNFYSAIMSAYSLQNDMHELGMDKKHRDGEVKVFICGGAKTYQAAFNFNVVHTVYANTYYSDTDFAGNHVKKLKQDPSFKEKEKAALENIKFKFVKMPPIPQDFVFESGTGIDFKLSETQHPTLHMDVYRFAEESHYRELVGHAISFGRLCPNRTGVDTLSMKGRKVRFSLKNNEFPLISLKRTYWKSAAKELRMLLKGDTEMGKLSWWKPDTTEAKRAPLGLAENEVGPTYGYMLRHFGAEEAYKHRKNGVEVGGFDQLAEAIRLLKESPTSRRNIMSLWSPQANAKSTISPCLMYYQWLVEGDKLTLIALQRSVDIGLGLPFNWASLGMLCHLMALHCGLVAHEVVWFGADVHIYTNHVEKMAEDGLLGRSLHLWPKLQVPKSVVNGNLWDFFLPGEKGADGASNTLDVTDYKPHPYISGLEINAGDITVVNSSSNNNTEATQ